jgi:hypothetical protein
MGLMGCEARDAERESPMCYDRQRACADAISMAVEVRSAAEVERGRSALARCRCWRVRVSELQSQNLQ